MLRNTVRRKAFMQYAEVIDDGRDANEAYALQPALAHQ